MPEGNKNIIYRCLSPGDFAALHGTFLEAFSDYFVPFQLSEKQLENHLAQNSVDLHLSVGAFAGAQMVGFTLNGFGQWNDRQTIYDAGTGVVPGFRKRGLGKGMFDFMMPRLRRLNVEQILLEVITKNESALNLYRRIGFEETRRLGFFEQTKDFNRAPKSGNRIEIRPIKNPDWRLLETFWDAKPSWQNSIEALENSLTAKIFAGAYLENRCVGYAVANRNSAIVAQLAVDKNRRRKGVASMLLSEMKSEIESGKMLRASNVDYALKNAFEFFKSANFEETLTQFEMIKTL